MAIPSAACMGPAAVRRKAKGTAISGMAAVRGKSSKHRVSSGRWPVLCEAVKTDSRFVSNRLDGGDAARAMSCLYVFEIAWSFPDEFREHVHNAILQSADCVALL